MDKSKVPRFLWTTLYTVTEHIEEDCRNVTVRQQVNTVYCIVLQNHTFTKTDDDDDDEHNDDELYAAMLIQQINKQTLSNQ